MSDETPYAPAHHARAAAGIRRWKARCALAAFLVTAVASHLAGATLDDTLLRGLAAGLVGYFAGWAAAVAVWRALMLAELRVATERRMAEARAAAAAEVTRREAAAAARAAREAA